MLYYKNYFLLAALAFSCAACEDVEITPNHSSPTSSSNLTQSQIVTGNTKFALDIYREVVDEAKNQILSPYSISTAMAMVYAGADSNTASEIQNVFGFGANNTNFHQTFNQVTNTIEANVNSPINSELNVINKIWRGQDISFFPAFENSMNTDYLAPIEVTNFAQAAVSRQLINQWVDQQTHQLIPNLIPDGFIGPNTKSVLVNALYFKADWAHQFSSHSTSQQAFTTSSNTVVNTDMMYGLIATNELKFTEDADAEVLELFFKDQESSILIVLPKNQSLGIDNFVQQILTVNKLNLWLANLAYPSPSSNFIINIPKWDFGSDFDLATTLETMGVNDAFKALANFSKMSPTALHIENIKHKAVIKSHEGGVEAAAATAIGVGPTGIPAIARTFTANRPFVFMVKDTETNSILFIGHVQDPR